jgi:nicotinate-nucleotide adenylyltransferase
VGGRKVMRLGLMGGTFDPIHLGHLIAAEEVRTALNLDRVLFLPAGHPPHKELTGISPAVHRVRMVELAISSNPYFELSLLDVARAGKSYTADTLGLVQKERGPGTELFFIVGMDSLAELLTWRNTGDIIALSRLAVVNRAPYPSVDLSVLEARLPGLSERVVFVPIPGIDIASVDLRDRVRRGLSIKYQVVEPVERYILDSGIYL